LQFWTHEKEKTEENHGCLLGLGELFLNVRGFSDIGSTPPCPNQSIKASKKINGERRRRKTVFLGFFFS
jgi:hypothetical protein